MAPLPLLFLPAQQEVSVAINSHYKRALIKCMLLHNSSKWAILCTPPPCTSLCVWGHLISHYPHHCSHYQCLCCHRWNLRFLRSDFRGQLPCHYSPHDNSTSVVPDHMNDLNREEPSRYVSVCNDSCSGLIVMLCVMSLFCWRVFPWMIMYICG